MDRKRQLKEEYKQLKKEMGLIGATCLETGRTYLEATNRTKASINKLLFTLKLGSHRCEELQREWSKYGEGAFEIKVLEVLEYDEREPDRDYTDDLELLKLEWIDRLKREGTELML